MRESWVGMISVMQNGGRFGGEIRVGGLLGPVVKGGVFEVFGCWI